MKDTVFYLIYPSPKAKRSGVHGFLGAHSGNCVAVITSRDGTEVWKDIVAPVDNTPNSNVALDATIWEHEPKMAKDWPETLRTRCKQIPESQARSVHPKLFTYLESNQ